MIYEEYTHMPEGKHFVLHTDLVRGLARPSSATNWHENLELQLCTQGAGYLRLDGQEYPFAAGDVAVINANGIHATATEDRMEYSALIVSTAFCAQMGIPYSELRFAPVINDPVAYGLFFRLKELHRCRQVPFQNAKESRLLLSLLIHLVQHHAVPGGHQPKKNKSCATGKAAIKYLRENFQRKITLEQLARSIYVDKYTLSREFKQVTGRTVVDYLNDYRCQRAAQILAAGATVTEAARACGFENLSFFSKTFQRYMRCKPSAYKDKRSRP